MVLFMWKMADINFPLGNLSWMWKLPNTKCDKKIVARHSYTLLIYYEGKSNRLKKGKSTNADYITTKPSRRLLYQLGLIIKFVSIITIIATKKFMINTLNIKIPNYTFKDYFILSINCYFNLNKIIIKLYWK